MYNIQKTSYLQDEYFHEDVMEFICDNSIKYQEIKRPKYTDDKKVMCKSLFGVNHIYNLRQGLPISTIRKINFNACVDELLWIWQKKSNDVMDLSSKIWDEWATTNNDGSRTIGKSYGYQLRKEVYKNPYPRVFGNRDKINRVEMLFYKLIFEPSDRRMIVNMYDDNDFDEMNLPPCAFMTMWNVNGNNLNMSLIQRSGDFLVAAHPGGWNCTQYAVLMYIIANCTGYIANKFNHYINDLHLYDRHESKLKELYGISSQRSLLDMENMNKSIFTIFQENNEETNLDDRLVKALDMFSKLTVGNIKKDEKSNLIYENDKISLMNYKYSTDIGKIEVAK